MTLLKVENLNKAFGKVIAANNISVEIGQNEMIGMIGANGAGKTTFVNMVTGYLKPDSGRIVFEDRDITLLEPRDITRIGICRSFQVAQVFLSSTVLENLMIALGAADRAPLALWRPLQRKEIHDRAEEILSTYQITDYRHYKADLLPQGVRKLLDIAMAVVRNPRVLLLDEPTSGVSVDEKFGIMDTVIAALKATQVTTLFVEHDMEIIERYSSRVLAFYDGGIISDGTPETVLNNEQVRQYVIGDELHRGAPRVEGGGDA